ncbi:AraC family transcriptional regulator [Enterococcus hulanensis]|uniref:AraC family transcriptional regulator n=1 Tax=Enterococcus hulanensis TaxID=2559929 RepID=UPI002891D113|nr:AraC family transcriptional regulator [Enterococcus hulanensis]MDT2660525.1 AraC family transcriptional regulator [Enterococcus hulanensis]
MEYLIEHFQKNVTCYYNTDKPNITLHLHNHLELFLFLQGDCHYFIDGKSYNLKRGQLLFINNNQIHGPTLFSDEVYERFSIHFSPQYLESLSSEKTSLLKAFDEGILLTQLTEEALEKMIYFMKLMIHEYQHPSFYGNDLQLSSLLTQILLLSNQSANSAEEVSDSRLPQLITDILQFIRENLSSPDLSLDYLAQHFAHNGIYLNRIFKQSLGSTIYQYILLSRISVAKRYLEKGQNVQNTCFLSGFNDYSNFIRTFKKITGVTPKQYIMTFKKKR